MILGFGRNELIMEIIYIITVLWLLISTMLIKKSEEKQNVLLRGILSIILFTIYNILLGYIFLIIRVPYTLLALSIVNVLISGINTFIVCRKKEIQKYFIRVKDIVFMVILLVVIVGIAITQYGFPFEIKYETTDPAVHFLFAKEMYDTKTLQWNGNMPAASINTEILFDTFDFIVSEQNFYYLFIIFDLIILYLIGAILYLGITNKIESKAKSIITMIFSILFVCGYPLNSVIFGYSYLTVGILYMTTLIAVSINIKNDELKLFPLCIEMFLILFGIFFSYYFFVPVVYSAFGLYILFDMIKNKKSKNIFSIITKENVIKVLTILILPTVLGFSYFVLPGLLQTGGTAIGHISTEGYIYRDLYSNFVLLAPLTIYYIIYNFKNKKNSFSTILMIISSLFTLYLLKRGLNGEVSSYYYFKMYFLLWILVLYMNIKAMFIMIENKNEIFAYSFTAVFLGILAISYTGYDYKISSINILFNPTNSINSYANIYGFNQTKVQSDEKIYSNTQLSAIKYLLNISEDKSNILINGKPLQMLWANSVWKITDTDDVVKLQIEEELDIENWIENDEKKYLIFFDTAQEVDRQTENYTTLYEVEDAVILEKK